MHFRIVLLGVGLGLGACGEASSPALPGEVWLIRDTTLVRVARGRVTPIAEHVFPSPYALPDGRIIAIASRGDGSPDGEQLVLASADGGIARLGPAAAQVRDPALAADGRSIVVAANTDGHSDLYRIALDGTTTRLTDEETGNFHPAFAGGELVYASSRDGQSELYTSTTRLTTEPRDDWDPTPSPDGKTIAFLSDRDGAARVYLLDASGPHPLGSHDGAADEDQIAWSRDGRQLAYVFAGHIFVHDLASHTERDVAAGAEPCFSPDGHWLALTRGGDVVALSLDTGDTVLLAHHAHLPRWF